MGAIGVAGRGAAGVGDSAAPPAAAASCGGAALIGDRSMYVPRVSPWLWPLWLFVEGIAGLIVLLLCLFSPIANWILSRVARGDRTVLVIHGYGMLSGSMLVVGWRLARA